MPAPFDASDFLDILSVHGENVTRIARSSGGTDALGETTWAEAAGVTFQAIVQDVSGRDLKERPGVFLYGDKSLFTPASVVLDPTDRLVLGGLRYQLVTETTEETAGVVIFREYVVRRTAP